MKYINQLATLTLLALITACTQADPDFLRLDADESNTVDREEYVQDFYKQGYFNLWDRNGDGMISQSEWQSGLESYYQSYAYQDTEFNDWNLNGDDFIDEEELANGVFTIYDANGDGEIEKVEYEVYLSEE